MDKVFVLTTEKLRTVFFAQNNFFAANPFVMFFFVEALIGSDEIQTTTF